MAINDYRLRIWFAVCLTLLISGLATGCVAGAGFKRQVHPLSIAITVSYSDRDGGPSDAIVRYSVPPPPPGRVYVMWAYTRGRAQIMKVGPVDAGTDVIAKGSAPFPIQGVMISEEDSPDVAEPGRIGIIEQNITDENLGPTAGNSSNQPNQSP